VTPGAATGRRFFLAAAVQTLLGRPRQVMQLWPLLRAANPLNAHFERMTARHLPVVVLEQRVDATVGIGNKAPPEDTP